MNTRSWRMGQGCLAVVAVLMASGCARSLQQDGSCSPRKTKKGRASISETEALEIADSVAAEKLVQSGDVKPEGVPFTLEDYERRTRRETIKRRPVLLVLYFPKGWMVRGVPLSDARRFGVAVYLDTGETHYHHNLHVIHKQVSVIGVDVVRC